MTTLVGYSDDRVVGDIRVRNLIYCTIFEDPKGLLDQRHVLWRRIDEEVYVFRRPCAAMRDDGEAANENVARAGIVQRPADPNEIFDLRLACARAIVRIIHTSASSKLLKR